MTRRFRLILPLVALLALVTAIPAAATPGAVDTTFGTAGNAEWAQSGISTAFIVARPAGGFAMSFHGLTYNTIGFVAFDAEGQVDTAFGDDGIATITIPG